MKRFIKARFELKSRCCRNVWTITWLKKIQCEWSTFSSMNST